MFNITLINMTDGTVEGHKAGCADIKRGRNHADQPWTFSVNTKHDAWLDYNADFLAECDRDDCDHDGGECLNSYVIDWKACANHVPAFIDLSTEVNTESNTNKKEPAMATNVILTIPGLFDDTMSFMAGDTNTGLFGVAVNKTFVLTDSLEDAEAWFGETEYAVLTTELDDATQGSIADEDIDMDESGLTTTGPVRIFQEVAQMIILAGEPGPRAEKWLTLVVADDAFAARQLERAAKKVAA